MEWESLIWDEANEAHIARHQVAPDEVEDVVHDRRARVLRTPSGRRLVIGRTNAGRWLLVVLAPAGADQSYPITARDLTPAEKRRYR